MKILAIETTGRTGSVALLQARDFVAEQKLPAHTRSGQSLAACIQQLLNGHGWTPQQVDLVAVARGPGSFTGLRVGIVTAKTFAYAVDAAVVGVGSLAALAVAAGGTTPVWCVMDAQRGEFLAAQFSLKEELPKEIKPTQIWKLDDWLEQLQSGDRIVSPILEKFADRLPDHVETVAEERWMPWAHAVGQLALVQFGAGARDDLWQFVPDYYRLSAAEEKLAAEFPGEADAKS